MTGTEERAAREALSLVHGGTSFSEAIEEVASTYNLSGHSVAVVANAVDAHR